MIDWRRDLTKVGADKPTATTGGVPTVPSSRPSFMLRLLLGSIPALGGWLVFGTPGAIVGGVAGAAIVDGLDTR